MIYIVLSVTCSVLVSVLLKLARRYTIDIQQAITWNYSVAAFLAWYFFRPDARDFSVDLAPVYAGLGILLPLLFFVLGLSVRFTGIVKTDIAQRLSLFIPVIAAFAIFREELSAMKFAGIALAFAAILCAIPWCKRESVGKSSWIYPVVVFVGMGLIDVLFKHISRSASAPFTSTLFFVFIIAFTISGLYLNYRVIRKKARPQLINLLCGWVLGVANFGNILFYLKAHQALASRPSLVFSGMNIGVILLGSAVGVLIFKEHLTKLNYLGIVLALIAVILMTLS